MGPSVHQEIPPETNMTKRPAIVTGGRKEHFHEHGASDTTGGVIVSLPSCGGA